MSRFPKLALAAVTLFLGATTASAAELLYNQVGYAPSQAKPFYVADSQATAFELVNTDSQAVVLTGSLSAPIDYPDGGISVRAGDFSTWTAEGRYFLRLDDGSTSAPFAINDSVYAAARDASLKGFYFNRASTALDAAHAGPNARPLGHPDTSVAFHSSTGRSDPNAASPKGWYDAGDFGKYVVNGGYALGTLLSLHELYPDAFGDSLGIPESGNGVSDLLDECRWEIEWFLTMQDSDGGVFHKLTTLGFAGYQMPHAATAQRYFIGKSTTATLNFAATLAQASRVYRAIDPSFADTCLAAAESAYAWAEANPSSTFSNPSGVSTGEYGDGNTSDEFVWAAAQLHIAGSPIPSLAQRLQNAAANPSFSSAAGWPSTRNLGLYALALDPVGLTEPQAATLRDALFAQADQILAQATANPLGIPMAANEFFWGSNGHIASKGVLLAHAFKLSDDSRYLAGMAAIADYLLGRNATGYSFLTGYGAQPPTAIHHRASIADSIEAPVPGFLAGGPNSGRQDGLSYPHLEPARSYVDHIDSYASNEIAVNWNAPFVLLLAALQQNLDQLANASNPADDAYRLAPFPATHQISAANGLLANDSIPPGAQGPLQAELLSAPILGEFQLAPDGSFTFAAPEGFVGNLYFTYQTRADSTESSPAVVTLTIHPRDPHLPAALAADAALWLDASSIDPANPEQTDSATSKLRLWLDRSANAHHAANPDSVTQPALVEDALHGRPMVQFGNDAFLDVGDIREEPGPVTTFVVSRSNSTDGDSFQRMVSGYTGSGNNWEAPNYFVSHPHLENETPQAYDGEITTQTDSGRALQNILLGVQSGNVNDFHGLIGELLIFTRALSADEAAAVEAYLADKWQLWDTLPTNHRQRTPDGYAAWLWSQPQLVGEDASPDADPNQNGLSNYFEYIFALDPLSEAPAPADLFSMTLHDGAPVIQLRALADFPHRGLRFATATSLENPIWSLPGDDSHIPFQPVSSTPTSTPGVSQTLLAPTAPLPAQLFLRLQR